MPDAAPQPAQVLGRTELTARHIAAATSGCAACRTALAVISVRGPAAAQCLQGLLTNDVDAAGDAAFQYAAVLTPKGMIISDLWLTRDGQDFHLFLPPDGEKRVREVFQRSLPPRLAQHADVTDELVVVRMAGPTALRIAADMDLPIPDSGQSSASDPWTVGRPVGHGPFALQIACSKGAAQQLEHELTARDCWFADQAALDLTRIVSGWPRLGVEIDEKTLPQEVRFDEHGGVSHSKGCYLGQETVARLHFRGHTNRRLAGLTWPSLRAVAGSAVEHEGRSVGRVTSIAWTGAEDRHVGLGLVRREVDLGASVTAAGAQASVGDLPHGTVG